jgi:cold shock CspA family protein
MARSQETAGKKEKQKIKAKKRKEKEEKREERRLNNNKGKGLDSMIAYLDENGNLTETPPDPRKRKEINIEDILTSPVAREEEEDEEFKSGRVMFFNNEKGFGFIKESKSRESVFVHKNSLLTPIKENDQVKFKVEQGNRGVVAVEVSKTE